MRCLIFPGDETLFRASGFSFDREADDN